MSKKEKEAQALQEAIDRRAEQMLATMESRPDRVEHHHETILRTEQNLPLTYRLRLEALALVSGQRMFQDDAASAVEAAVVYEQFLLTGRAPEKTDEGEGPTPSGDTPGPE